MRLLNTSTYTFQDFSPVNAPPYAILSHTWGDEEILFEHIVGGWEHATRRKGWSKVSNCCKKAAFDSWQWIWIDTCCIDKSSSAELSEAINSMFKWYQDAHVCFTYLADVDLSDSDQILEDQFAAARWFTRGWTLQELLACEQVMFYDTNWQYIASKASLATEISGITFIDPECLIDNEAFRSRSVAQRMSWAASRKTTRPEDIAYCLLGLFDVNMPLLYGEGLKAFRRLQLEILKVADDHSIFAWIPKSFVSTRATGMLAPQVADFAHALFVRQTSPLFEGTNDFAMTNAGFRIELLLSQEEYHESIDERSKLSLASAVDRNALRFAILDCISSDIEQHVAIVLQPAVSHSCNPELDPEHDFRDDSKDRPESNAQKYEDVSTFIRWTAVNDHYYAMANKSSIESNVFDIIRHFDGHVSTFRFKPTTILIKEYLQTPLRITYTRKYLHAVRVPAVLGPARKIYHQRPDYRGTQEIQRITYGQHQITLSLNWKSELLRKSCAIVYEYSCPSSGSNNLVMLAFRAVKDTAHDTIFKYSLYKIDDLLAIPPQLKPATTQTIPDDFLDNKLEQKVRLGCGCTISCVLRPCGASDGRIIDKPYNMPTKMFQITPFRTFDLALTVSHFDECKRRTNIIECIKDLSDSDLKTAEAAKLGESDTARPELECFDANDFGSGLRTLPVPAAVKLETSR